jgi:hypothetical protein
MNDTTDFTADPRDEIARLEARIEELAEDLERGRKIGVFAKVLLAGGTLWLVAGLLGIMNLGPAMMGAITAILGGFVLKGSNDSSSRQAQAALNTAENARTDLICAMALRTVDGRVDAGPPEPVRWLH